MAHWTLVQMDEEQQNGSENRIRIDKYVLFLFFVILCLNVADLVSDWLLYHDVNAAELGLVFGPPDKKIAYSLLAFSCIGTVLFSLEILSLGKGIFTEKPLVDIDIMSAVVIWLEDIPQIIISCAIFACREEAISVFQITKASIVIFGAFIKTIVGIHRLCNNCPSSDGSNDELKQCNTFKFIMFFGLILLVTGSVIVFIFAQSSLKDGKWKFKAPETLWEGKYHDSKYFERVGVYGNLGFLDNKGAENAKQDKKNPANTYWLKFFQLYDIHLANDFITVVIVFDAYNRSNLKIQTFFNDTAANNTDECYIVHRFEWSVSRDPNCTLFSHIQTSKEEIQFTFSYVKPRANLVFGDIHCNVRGTMNGTCISSSKLNIDADKILSPNFEMELRYFKAKEDFQSGYIVETISGNLTFYDPQHHLVDITNVWKTGFVGCFTGRVCPLLISDVSSC